LIIHIFIFPEISTYVGCIMVAKVGKSCPGFPILYNKIKKPKYFAVSMICKSAKQPDLLIDWLTNLIFYH